jgi:hypothetical protein
MGISSVKDGELLYPEDRQVFRVDVSQAGQLHAWISGSAEAPNQPYVDLLYANCSFSGEMQAYDETGMGIYSGTLVPGTYYLSVIPEPHTLGPFTLHVDFSVAPDLQDPFWDVLQN